ncbi:hypothetical protein EON79_11765 [bacterium]|nr:MAG: hypothetical protein EON79_11765 [bacterium]
MKNGLPLGIAALVLTAGSVLWIGSHRAASKVAKVPAVVEKPSPEKDVALLESPEAKAPVPTPKVAEARLREAHRAAKRQDWKGARTQFLLAAKAPAPKGPVGPFGSLSDQGLYQAAATLAGEGRAQESKLAFLSFIKERPGSPLVHAAKKRVDRFGDEAASTEAERLLQLAIERQEKRVRFEMSVCGPKAIVRILPTLGKAAPSYKTLAQECGTTDSGTTLEGLRKGLKKHGVESWAYRLNREDLLRAPLPAILLHGDHYVVLEKIDEKTLAFFDPSVGSIVRRATPSPDDSSFSIDVVLFRQPELRS